MPKISLQGRRELNESLAVCVAANDHLLSFTARLIKYNYHDASDLNQTQMSVEVGSTEHICVSHRTETSANFLRKSFVRIRVSRPPERTLMREHRKKGGRRIGDENELSEWTRSAPKWREVSNLDESGSSPPIIHPTFRNNARNQPNVTNRRSVLTFMQTFQAGHFVRRRTRICIHMLARTR